MNVEIGAEAAQFPEKEYIIGIAVAVQPTIWLSYILSWSLECENELTMKFCTARISLYTYKNTLLFDNVPKYLLWYRQAGCDFPNKVVFQV